MKLHLNILASELVSSLLKFGYKISRQKGSHLRLTTLSNGQHHITMPNHNPIKLGTLSSKLGQGSEHFKLTKGETINKLFG